MQPDHPHTDPGDGRTECERCGKWVWPVLHSCKGIPVTESARARHEPAPDPMSTEITAKVREIAEEIETSFPFDDRAARGYLAGVAAGRKQAADALADLRERFAALAVIEEYIGESCDNASHNIREVLKGDDPRPNADRWELDYRAIAGTAEGGEPSA